MNKPEFFEAKKTSKLFGLKKDFDFISSLYLSKKLPRVTMISGIKGFKIAFVCITKDI